MNFNDAQYQSDLRLIQLTGEDVIYARGEYRIPWRAIVGRSNHEMVTIDNTLTTFESDDFIGQADLLVIDEEPTTGQLTPERGDRIMRQVGKLTLTYEVQNPTGKMCYYYSAPDRRILRVHTKLIQE